MSNNKRCNKYEIWVIFDTIEIKGETRYGCFIVTLNFHDARHILEIDAFNHCLDVEYNIWLLSVAACFFLFAFLFVEILLDVTWIYKWVNLVNNFIQYIQIF